MARVIVFFYDENVKRARRKRLAGQNIDYKETDAGFVRIVVDNEEFVIKAENVISLNISRE